MKVNQLIHYVTKVEEWLMHRMETDVTHGCDEYYICLGFREWYNRTQQTVITQEVVGIIVGHLAWTGQKFYPATFSYIPDHKFTYSGNTIGKGYNLEKLKHIRRTKEYLQNLIK